MWSRAFLIDRAIAVKHHDTAAGAQRDALRCVAHIDGCLVEFGDSIWLAMVRFQIRS